MPNTFSFTANGYGFFTDAEDRIMSFTSDPVPARLANETAHLPFDAHSHAVRVPLDDIAMDPEAFRIHHDVSADPEVTLIAEHPTPSMRYLHDVTTERNEKGRFERVEHWEYVPYEPEPESAAGGMFEEAFGESTSFSQPEVVADAVRRNALLAQLILRREEAQQKRSEFLQKALTNDQRLHISGEDLLRSPRPAEPASERAYAREHKPASERARARETRFIRVEEHTPAHERVAANQLMTHISSADLLRAVLDVLESEPLDTDSPLRNAVCNALTIVLDRKAPHANC